MKALQYMSPAGVIALILATGFGCDQKKPQMQAPPPVSISVAHPIVRDVNQWDEYNGRLESVETVAVKAHVSGFVTSVPFIEGSLVHKGDLLLTIDPRPFQAQLDSAKADQMNAEAKLQVDLAQLQLANADLKRGETASQNGVLSDQELDTKRAMVSQMDATVAQAHAGIAAAKAAVDLANQSVEWCTVTAPITGRISDKRMTMGNFLTGGSGNDATVITTIKSLDPIYGVVDADESSVQKYLKLAREKKRVSAQDSALTCYMGIDDEVGFPHEGHIDFLDNNINPATATRKARAVFPNPDGVLLPGFHARMRIIGESYKNAMLVLDESIGTDQDRKFLYVLAKGGASLERRTVNVGPLEGELRVVESGIQPDDLVLVNGGINVRPMMALAPTTVPMPEHSLPPETPGGAAMAPPSTQPAATAPTATQAAAPEAGR